MNDLMKPQQNARSINKVVALLIPGLTPDLLSLPPLPTSATSNPNLPLQVPLPPTDANSSPGVPFINSTFTYACPTRAPGDQTRMHSVLNAFFQGPVTGEEKKRRLTERLTCECRSHLHKFSTLSPSRFSRTSTREESHAILALS